MEFNVRFHFDKENSVTLTVQGPDEQTVLSSIYSYGGYFDGTYKNNKVLHRVNLKQVTHISVHPLSK